MILCRYGDTVDSVETNFDSKALTEIGFRRNDRLSFQADEFLATHRAVAEHLLIAEAEGDVHDEVESIMLGDLLDQLSRLEEGVSEDEVLFVASEKGKDYPKTRTRQTNVIVEGENRLYFHTSIDPPLRVEVMRRSAV